MIFIKNIKRGWLVVIVLVTALLIYGTINSLVLGLSKNYLKHNFKSETFETEAFENNTDYYIYLAEKGPVYYPQTDNIKAVLVDYDDTHDILNQFEGKSNVLLTDESGSVTYEVEVSEAGFYRLVLSYYQYEDTLYPDYPQLGKSSDIERALYINDESPFESANNITFLRRWGNSGIFEKDDAGNDIRPAQVEKPTWTTSYFRDPAGYIDMPYTFYFEEGVNTITLKSIKEPMVIEKIELESVKELKSYETVKQSYQGVPVIDDYLSFIEGESATSTSSPTLYPLNDRSSFLTSPNTPSKIKLNSIGGINWRVAGSQIEWEFEVPKTGLYEISLRLKQKQATGMVVSRNVYIDGEIPFEEMLNYEFVQSNNWRIQTFGTKDEAFKFYLEEGKHVITLETSLGQYGLIISEVDNIVDKLSKLYREIIVVTGAVPDEHRDYKLTSIVDNLVERLEENKDALIRVREGLINISGSKSEKTGIIDTVVLLLEGFIEKPSELHKKLGSFEDNIASLGTLITLLDQQPLQIDYLAVHSEAPHLPQARENFFQTIWYGLRSFIASFTINYAEVGKISKPGHDNDRSIDVWLTVGQDQTNILRRLINDDFTKNTDIQVNLKLVSGAALLPATLSGKGPDVALGVGASVPVNYAMRNAAYDLTQFDDFEETASQFHESGIIPFSFSADETHTGVYALPETQTFLMMFYRTDIFEELNFNVPTTWQEVVALIANLQKYHLEFYLPVPVSVGAMTLAPNPVFATMFYQNDGEFYLENGRLSGFNEGKGPEVFERWTRFYTDYSFALDANFINRFRSGQMPIGLTYYNTYNTLAVFAPEIRGKWDFTFVPGTEQQMNGETILRRDTVSSVSGSMILNQTKNPNDSWEFLKWWLSTDTQVAFGREMEGILGAAARYPTANIAALEKLPWTVKERDRLLEQWELTRGIPEVPGAYMTGRHLDNAFRKVINDQTAKPRETLYDYVQTINRELEKKRREFGLD